MVKFDTAKAIQVIRIVFPILLFLLIMIEIYQVVVQTDFQLLKYELQIISVGRLIIIIFLSVCAITPMLLYDVILYKELRVNLPNQRILSQAFVTNTFSNIMGFGGAIGLALRSYFLARLGIEKGPLIKKITSVTLFAISGVSILSWIVLIAYRDLDIFSNMKWATIGIIFLACYLPALLLIQYILGVKAKKQILNMKLTVQLVCVSIFEWLFFFLIIACLVKSLHIPISTAEVFPIYIIAISVGIISLIPGGAGSFDLVFLLGLASLGIQKEQVLALLILFRLCYYFIPFIIGIFIFTNEIRLRYHEEKR